jgi:hypothetical protein
VTNILEKDPTPLRKFAPRRPTALEGIVTQLLAKRADERYQSAADLHAALAALPVAKGLFRRFLGS